jgi:triacylglycerol lipase
MAFWREDLGLLAPDESDEVVLAGESSGWNVVRAFSLTNLAALAYEPEGTVRSFLAKRACELLEYRSLPHRPIFKIWSYTGWFAARREQDLIISFRGTEPSNLLNWATNVSIVPVAANRFISGATGMIHAGFAEAFATVWPLVERVVRDFGSQKGTRVWITGHSLGGAVGLLTAAAILFNDAAFGSARLAGLYTCGQPRVGSAAFIDALMERIVDRYFRIVHGNDIVPHLPPENLAPVFLQRIRSPFGSPSVQKNWTLTTYTVARFAIFRPRLDP